MGIAFKFCEILSHSVRYTMCAVKAIRNISAPQNTGCAKKKALMPYANNKSPDQPAHPVNRHRSRGVGGSGGSIKPPLDTKLFHFHRKILGTHKYFIHISLCKVEPFCKNPGSTSEWTLYHSLLCITKTLLFKFIENFTTKEENFQIIRYFLISAQNTDYGYLLEPPWWGGSNEYPQSKFLSRNKKINVYPCKLQFYHIKVGLKGVKLI